MDVLSEMSIVSLLSRCSRVYWSTLDARKRCVYTCRILVCHPPVVKSDAKAVMAPEENRTIAHSPPPMTGNLQTLSPLCCY